MAFSPIGTQNIRGLFVEKDHGRYFEYQDNPNPESPYPHQIFVGSGGFDTEIRLALIKKTVAYIVVDETDQGFITEKWSIKNHSKYK